MIDSIFGRINPEGDFHVLYVDDGSPVTRFDETIRTVYPVDSELSVLYEHPDGIVLTPADAKKIGLKIEE